MDEKSADRTANNGELPAKIEDPFAGIEFANPSEEDMTVTKKVNEIVGSINEELNPLIVNNFLDPELYLALSESIKGSDEQLKEYLIHSSRFAEIITKERSKSPQDKGLLGEEVSIPETTHADGRRRREEVGRKVRVEYLEEIGIDPARVLFFRLTQPSENPKPEYYWTSDYTETQGGLNVEVGGEQRAMAVILVADLKTINENGGLIQDINDDSGISVRQIGQGPFDQAKAIAAIHPKSFQKVTEVRTELKGFREV